MRELDRQTSARFDLPSITLMENAAGATARALADLFHPISGRSFLVLCGKGNNGGDGAATARLLANAGARVNVVLIGGVADTTGDARTNFDRLSEWSREHTLREVRSASIADSGSIDLFECESEKAWQQLSGSVLAAPYDAIVDAIFGTGLTRPAAGIHAAAIRYVNDCRQTAGSPGRPGPLIVSIDVPSGLNADSEKPIGDAVQADLTVCLTAPKCANVLPPAADFNGKLTVAEIGTPADLITAAATDLFASEAEDGRRWLIATRYTPNSYKNVHGRALVIAGSRGYTGAAVLCGNAAMCAGAGMVTVATPASSQPLVATAVMPEIMTTAIAETDRGAVSDQAIEYALQLPANAIAVGPGLSAEDERTRNFVRGLVERRRTPIIIDADGLNCLAPWPADLKGSIELPIILTPHAGEMLRLLGVSDKSVLEDRIAIARQFATAHHVILVLKGSRTIVAAPDGRVSINTTGNAGLGTAGAGDTLTGVITGFVAQALAYEVPPVDRRVSVLETVIAAVYISGLAGDLAADAKGMRGMVASDITAHLSSAFLLLDPIGERPLRKY